MNLPSLLFSTSQIVLLTANWAEMALFYLNERFQMKKKKNVIETTKEDDWSMVNPLQISKSFSKPFRQWTIQECLDSLSAFVISGPRIHASQKVLQSVRWSTTLIATIATMCLPPNHSKLRKRFFHLGDEKRFLKISQAFGQLMEREDSAEYWVQKSACSPWWWHYLRQINLALFVLCLILVIRVHQTFKQIAANRADSNQGIDKSKEESKSKPNLASFKEVMRATHWTTRIVCLLVVILLVGRLWVLWQLIRIESNPFHVLGISPTTDTKTIKKAFRRFSMQYLGDD